MNLLTLPSTEVTPVKHPSLLAVATVGALAGSLALAACSDSGADGQSSATAAATVQQSASMQSGGYVRAVRATAENDPERDKEQSGESPQSAAEREERERLEREAEEAAEAQRQLDAAWAQFDSDFDHLDAAILATAQEMDALDVNREGGIPGDIIDRFNSLHGQRDAIAGTDYADAAAVRAGIQRVGSVRNQLTQLQQDISNAH